LDALVAGADGRVALSRLQNVTYSTQILFQAAIVNPRYEPDFYTALNNITTYQGVLDHYTNMTAFNATTAVATVFWQSSLQQCAGKPCTVPEISSIFDSGMNYLLPVRTELQNLFAIFNGIISDSSVAAAESFQVYEEIISVLLLFSATLVLVVTGAVVLKQFAEYNKQRRELEARVELANAEVRSRTSFISIVNHEARSSLNSVIAMAELLQLTTLDENQKELLTTLQLGTASLLFQINDLLLYLKVQSGNFKIHPVWISSERYFNNICKPFVQRAAIKNVVFEPLVCNAMPKSVCIDADRYKQIIINLLENSMKFTTRGYIRCTFSFIEFDNMLQAKIEDTGIGMTAEECERIWLPFVQANPTISETYGGSGLGCSIVKELAECMGGTVTVTSSKGEGSVFVVRVKAEGDNTRDIPPTSIIQIDSSDLARIPQHVLVVDDALSNRKIMVSMLKSLRCRNPDVATNGLEAVAYWETHPDVEIILMDMQMPYMDGIEATRNIRMMEQLRGRTRVRIIGVTGNVLDEDIGRCLSAGMDVVISKPITRLSVLNAIVNNNPIQTNDYPMLPPHSGHPLHSLGGRASTL
jgi:signal transduction histidine kinase/CheY-like chemotaxis protein